MRVLAPETDQGLAKLPTTASAVYGDIRHRVPGIVDGAGKTNCKLQIADLGLNRSLQQLMLVLPLGFSSEAFGVVAC